MGGKTSGTLVSSRSLSYKRIYSDFKLPLELVPYSSNETTRGEEEERGRRKESPSQSHGPSINRTGKSFTKVFTKRVDIPYSGYRMVLHDSVRIRMGEMKHNRLTRAPRVPIVAVDVRQLADIIQPRAQSARRQSRVILRIRVNPIYQLGIESYSWIRYEMLRIIFDGRSCVRLFICIYIYIFMIGQGERTSGLLFRWSAFDLH